MAQTDSCRGQINVLDSREWSSSYKGAVGQEQACHTKNNSLNGTKCVSVVLTKMQLCRQRQQCVDVCESQALVDTNSLRTSVVWGYHSV